MSTKIVSSRIPQTRRDAIAELTKYTSRLREGHIIPPPKKDSVANTDFNLSFLLRREFSWKNPKWIPYTKAEGRLPVGSLYMLINQGWKVGVMCWVVVIQIYTNLGRVSLAEDAYRSIRNDTANETGTSPTSSKYNHRLILDAMLWLYAYTSNAMKFKQTWQYMVSLEMDFCGSCYAAAATLFQKCGLENQTKNILRYCIANEVTILGKMFVPFFSMVRSGDDVRKTCLMYTGLVKQSLGNDHISAVLLSITKGVVDREWNSNSESDLKDGIESVISVLLDHTSEVMVRSVELWIDSFQVCAGNKDAFNVLFDLLKSNHQTDIDTEDISAWHNILRACVKANCIPTAETSFSQIATPGPSAYSDLIGLYVNNKIFGKITQLWKSMSVEPNRLCYSLYIQACGDKCSSPSDLYLRLGELLFEQATDRDLPSGDLFMFAMMMRLYVKAGDARKARLLERLRVSTGTPKGKLYRTFFREVSPGPTPSSQFVWLPLSDEKEPSDEEMKQSEESQDDELPDDSDDLLTSEIMLRRARIRKLAWSSSQGSHSSD